MRKVIVVDRCRGVVIQHALYDDAGTLVAKADFSEHRQDPVSGAVLPHRVELQWPETGLSLSMRLGRIEVNPLSVPEKTWQLPNYPDCPVVDLAKLERPR